MTFLSSLLTGTKTLLARLLPLLLDSLLLGWRSRTENKKLKKLLQDTVQK